MFVNQNTQHAMNNEKSNEESLAVDILGGNTQVYDASFVAPSLSIPGEQSTIKLTQILEGLTLSMGMTDPTGDILNPKSTHHDQQPIPSLLTNDGQVVTMEEAEDTDARMVDPTLIKENPHGYNSLLSQQAFFPNLIDFGFLSYIIENSNLGNIRELPSHNSSNVSFVLSLQNRVSDSMAVQFGENKPVFLFSSFYRSFQLGEIAKDMSNGTNLGWQTLDSEWVKKAFSVFEDENVEKPFGYGTFDTERFLVDHSTAILMRSYINLPYERSALSLRFHKVEGFISEIVLSGTYEKKNFQELAGGILLLLEDTKKLKNAAEPYLRTIETSIEKQTKELGGEMGIDDYQKFYSDLLEITFKDDPNLDKDGIDYASAKTEGGGQVMFLEDRKELVSPESPPEEEV